MNRKETTKFLSEVLERDRLMGIGKYYAKEVSIDPWSGEGIGGRVDYMQFIPPNQYAISSLEKGIFVCYEIKSCKEDVYSGNGLNFYGEKNYIVTTMQCYKDILPDIRSRKFQRHIEAMNPGRPGNAGILVAIPRLSTPEREFENPTEIGGDGMWKLSVVKNCIAGARTKAMAEMLFCMLRSGH